MAVPRLFLDHAFAPQVAVPLAQEQAHYLRQVMRLADGAALTVFNGRDGSWPAHLRHEGKKSGFVQLGDGVRMPQRAVPDVWLMASPLKQNRFDLMVEKATELGVSRIVPVLTQRASVRQVNTGRLRQIAIEAAEQCERDAIPDITELTSLPDLLGAWDASRPLLMADEAGEGQPPAQLLPQLSLPLAILIGPEGGFAPAEQEMLRAHPAVKGLSLGPRILRAETAAIAGLAVLLAQLGDWAELPRFGA